MEPLWIDSGGLPRTIVAPDAPILEVKALVVRKAGKTLLDVPSLAVMAGEVLVIIGPNGAGKSTLLRVMALLERPTSGELLFDGQKVDSRANPLAFRRRTATVFQEPLLCDGTVFDNAALGLRLRGTPKKIIRREVGEWLERLGIGHLARQQARTLSGGEAQRLSLTRALAIRPEILFMDEPFAALDAPTRMALLEDIERILRDTDVTTVMVTHDRTEALMMGDRVAVMMEGRILQWDTPEGVFTSPNSEAVAAFVGVETILPGRVVQQQEGLATVEVQGRKLQVVSSYGVGQAVLVCLRPEDVVLAPYQEAIPVSSARNTLAGVVARLVPLGSQYRVVVECGFPVVALITKQSCLDLGLATGMPVTASFKATAAHLLLRK